MEANQWEQEAERARRDFVSMVSHELRTPLTSIHGSLELIASGRFGDLPPQVGKLVGIAARNTDRLVRLSRDVVDLHQMRRGQLHLRLDGVHGLPEIVEQAVDAVKDVAEHAAVPVVVAHGEPAKVRGDADRLVQVVTTCWSTRCACHRMGEQSPSRAGTVTWFRYALEATQVDGSRLLRFLMVVLVVQWALGLTAHLYRGRYWVGSLDEAIHLARVMIAVGIVALAVDLGLPAPLVPRSVPLTSAFFALVISWTVRCAIRRRREHSARPDRAHAQRLIIFRAGGSGQQLVRSMLVDPASGYLPVGLLDDDPAKRPLRICGVPVCGAGADVVARTGATPLVIAVLREAIRSMGTYLSVRFGNVLGSRGSVLTTFTEQLAQGGPTTVTHREVTRFFMTIPEAVQLVIQAAVIGRSGEALVLDMGAPVRIADIARQLMEMSGKSAPIVYTGLLEGEKLHEDLFGSGELDRRPLHAAISHVIVPPLDPVRLWSVALVRAEVAALSECAALQAVATTPVPVEPADRCDANATS